MEIPDIPFKVLALATFLSGDAPTGIRETLRIRQGELSEALKILNPVLRIPMPQTLCPAGSVDLQFKEIKDFTPDGLIQSNRHLSQIKEASDFMADAGKKGLSENQIRTGLQAWPDLPALKVQTPQKDIARKPGDDTSSQIDSILSMVAMPENGSKTPLESRTVLSDLDRILSQCMVNIFDYEPFRQMEAAWRGLELLMKHGGTNGQVEIDIFPCEPELLEENLSFLMAQQLQDPPSLVLVDMPFDSSPRCLDLMKKIAEFSETLLAPSMVWITPKFFQINSWKDLDKLTFLPHHLDDASFAKWRILGDSPAGRWLGVIGNCLLARYPYGPDNKPRQVSFAERRSLWISPVWAVGNLICRRVIQTGWPTRFVGMKSGSLENLPLDMTDPRHPHPAETALSENRIDQMVKAGIMPMAGVSGRDFVFLPSAVTTGRTPVDYQLLVGLVTRLILWCQDKFEEGLESATLKGRIREAFRLFWEHRGNPEPEMLEIDTGNPDSEGKIPVRIILTPSRQILPSGEKVELSLLW